MISQEIVDEINVLVCFDLSSLQTGIKVHESAGQAKVDAAKRLFDKGLITQADGGYLTDSGHEAAEHLLHLSGLLGIASSQS